MSLKTTISTMLAASALSASFAHAGSVQVFIPEGSAGTVRIVDAETGALVGRINDVEAVHGLAGSPNSPYLIAGSYAEVDREDTADMTKPEAVSQDEHAAHHAKPKKQIGPTDAGISLLTVIDAASGDVVRRIEVPGAVHHVAVSPDGRRAVATHPSGDGVSVVDLQTFELTAWIPTGAMANYVVFGTDPDVAFVSNAGNGTVSEVDLNRGIVRRNLIAGDAPEHLAIDPAANRLYAADADAGRVVEIDLKDGRQARRFEIGGEIHGLDFSDDRTQLFVAGKATDRVISIDLATGEINAKQLAPAPYHLTTIPGTGLLFVSSRDEPKVWIVDAGSLTVLSEIPIEGEGHQMVAR